MKRIFTHIIKFLPLFILAGIIISLVNLIKINGWFFLATNPITMYLLNTLPTELSKLGIKGLLLALNIGLYIKLLKFSYMLLGVIYLVIFPSNNSKKKLVKKYLSSLTRLSKEGNLISIINEHLFFAQNIMKDFTIEDKDLAVFYSSKNNKAKIKNFNNLIMKHIGDKNYIKDVEIQDDYFKCSINKGELDGETLIKKIENLRSEIVSFFNRSDFKANMKIQRNNFNDIQLHIYNENNLWENQSIQIQDIKLKKGQLLCGFYPEIKKAIIYKNYYIQTSNLYHSFVAGATRSGKDVFMRNILFSCLYNIKNYKNLELHFFDTKGNDGVFLDNLKAYGINRYTDLNGYKDLLQSLVEEMRKIQSTIAEYSNLENYNKTNKKTPLKEKIIIINEFLSLAKRIRGKELDELLGYLVSLTSEGAGAGYKCIFMSQTARKDSNAKISEILVNIKTKFALKVNNMEESFILSRGLIENDKARVINIKHHNTFHIEDNKIQQEFKAYFFEQSDLIDRINNNFDNKKSFSKDEINDYLQFAKDNDEISYKIATKKFGLTRTDWNRLIKYLENNNLITRLENNTIIWKK